MLTSTLGHAGWHSESNGQHSVEHSKHAWQQNQHSESDTDRADQHSQRHGDFWHPDTVHTIADSQQHHPGMHVINVKKNVLLPKRRVFL